MILHDPHILEISNQLQKMRFINSISPDLTKNMHKEQITMLLRINFASGSVLVRFIDFFSNIQYPLSENPLNMGCAWKFTPLT